MAWAVQLCLEAYTDGLDAAYRHGKYLGVKNVPPCPYPQDTKEAEDWWLGFGDGTEDLIEIKRLDSL